MFVDRVTLELRAGRGGHGIVSWRREKYIPKGGPAGGDGGNGASIFIEVDPNIYSLEDFRNKSIIKGENGRPGGGDNRKGRTGRDHTLKVPKGTLIKDAAGHILYDLTETQEPIKLCQGGKGGKGNTFFKSPTNRTPNQCTDGTVGETVKIELELKLLADVGFVGMPNAGKSTLMSRITRVPVKIAPYPFTTLSPNLGIVEYDDFSRILVADIPGIISDAHIDRGLGLSFLKHIERTSTLVFLIDASAIEGRDPYEDFEVLRKELHSYDPKMLEKPFFVVLNKIDEIEAQEHAKEFRKKYPFDSKTLFEISASEGEGVSRFLNAMRPVVQRDGKRFS